MADGIKPRSEVGAGKPAKVNNAGDNSAEALREVGIDIARPSVDTEAAVQSKSEKRQSAARTLYEAERTMIVIGVAIEYLAELAGLTEDEIENVQNVAERDEYNALGLEDEQDAIDAGLIDPE